ncbi:MAG: hypothetical protein PVH61_13340 [Candidatus Aminicenantes bacterium]|jgi:hypothetical protein
MPRVKKSRKIDSTILAALISSAAVIIATVIGPALNKWCSGFSNKEIPRQVDKYDNQPGKTVFQNPGQESGKNNAYDPFVYITKTGKSYHSKNCSYLKKSKIKIKLSEAKRRGFKPCSRCKPPQ